MNVSFLADLCHCHLFLLSMKQSYFFPDCPPRKVFVPQQAETQVGGSQRRRYRLRVQDEAQGDVVGDGDKGGLSSLHGVHLAGLSPIPVANHERANHRGHGC